MPAVVLGPGVLVDWLSADAAEAKTTEVLVSCTGPEVLVGCTGPGGGGMLC